MILKKRRSNYQAYSHWASSATDIKDLKANLRTNMVPTNHPSQKDDSGLSLHLRLSGTLLAMILGAGISFGSGFAVANANNSNQKQTQNVNCEVPQSQPAVSKH